MATDATSKIESLEDGFRAFGYIVTASAVPGEETQWADTLRAAFTKMEETLAYIQRAYKCRGKSARAMKILHSVLPSPDWGIEVREG